MSTPADDLTISYADLDRHWKGNRSTIENQYTTGTSSFLKGLLPPTAIAMPVGEVVEILSKRFGPGVTQALAPSDNSSAMADYPSPVSDEKDTSWLQRQNVAGINVRTVGSFWRVVHYCLTLPEAVGAVHLLPVWEPGVVGSLYGMASWEINDEFFDRELANVYPHLGTAASQLAATLQILHICGRSVGMDVIPHTDRFSQIVLAGPAMFEWLRRDDKRITHHRSNLHEEVEDLIYQFVLRNGPAALPNHVSSDRTVPDRESFFSASVSEETRCRLLFGEPEDRVGRNGRRGELVRAIHAAGYEPVPATMAPPYRGIEVDPGTRTVDGSGALWLDYRIIKPHPMSRVFGPLTRYKLYERIDDNSEWQIDFDRPRTGVWDYVTSHYAAFRERFGFDFMRGDMSHVQMRPDGVPAEVPEHYDLLGAVKKRVNRTSPSFAYFAETFMAPPGVMGYGDEVSHLEASGAEVTLGDLQSVEVATDDFVRRLRRYLDIRETRTVAPSFTVMTADKDDPRFDSFYLAGNELRWFCALFLTRLPSYTALGFELRDPHPEPAPNEHYSKLYVFQVHSGKHATSGPYQFGTNAGLFGRIQRIHAFADGMAGRWEDQSFEWLLPPDATAGTKVLAWALCPNGTTGENSNGEPSRLLVFVANCDTVAPALNVRVPVANPIDEPKCIFSTVEGAETAVELSPGGFHARRIGRGECRVYEAVMRGKPARQKQGARPKETA